MIEELEGGIPKEAQEFDAEEKEKEELKKVYEELGKNFDRIQKMRLEKTPKEFMIGKKIESPQMAGVDESLGRFTMDNSGDRTTYKYNEHEITFKDLVGANAGLRIDVNIQHDQGGEGIIQTMEVDSFSISDERKNRESIPKGIYIEIARAVESESGNLYELDRAMFNHDGNFRRFYKKNISEKPYSVRTKKDNFVDLFKLSKEYTDEIIREKEEKLKAEKEKIRKFG